MNLRLRYGEPRIMDLSAVVDEIALEGLDGITINALWHRLESRPDFCQGSLDNCYKQCMWKNLTLLQEVEFYKLPEPRADLIIFDYNDYIQPDVCKCLLPLDVPDDIYSIENVMKDDVFGSCNTYDTRTSISSEIRSCGQTLVTFQEALEKWGQQLVMVASQRLRFIALFDTDFLPSGVNSDCYCLMEKIGRSRYIGELTVCQAGLRRGLPSSFVTRDLVFFFVKYLCSRGFTTKQPFNVRYSGTEGKGSCHIRLVHLKRFYQVSRSNATAHIRKIGKFLGNKVGTVAAYDEIHKHMNVKVEALKKQSVVFKDHFKIIVIPYTELYPNCNDDEWKSKCGKERKMRCLQLIKAFDMGIGDDEDDMEEMDETEDVLLSQTGDKASRDTRDKSANVHCRRSGFFYDLPVLGQLRSEIKRRGCKGMTEKQICNTYGISSNMASRLSKSLLDLGVVEKQVVSLGTTSTCVLVCSKIAKEMKQKKGKPVTQNKEPEMIVLDDIPVPSEPELTPKMAKEMEETLANMNLTWRLESGGCELLEDNSKAAKPMSDRKKDRGEFILKVLEKRRIVNKSQILFDMQAWEESRNLDGKMCRKSLARLLDKMYMDRKLNNLVVINKDTLKETRLLADLSVKESDMCVKQEVLKVHSENEYKKMKTDLDMTWNSESSPSKRLRADPVLHSTSSVLSILEGFPEDSMVVVKEEDAKGSLFKRAAPIRKARYERARCLHEFLFYLLYGFKGRKPKEPEQAKNEDEPAKPPMYLDVHDWRRYVPPLEEHNAHLLPHSNSRSICMLGDVLMSLPVGLLCSIVNITWPVEGLDEVLNDHDQQFYPILHLPSAVKKSLMFSRKCLGRIKDVVLILCRMGLVTLGPRTVRKELEYLVLYVRQHTVILDTQSSLPGYLMTHSSDGEPFPEIHFKFDTFENIKDFWYKVKLISLGSNIGQQVQDEVGNQGTVSVVEACNYFNLEEIQEEGWLPGDRRGAAGYDSSLCMAVLSNWNTANVLVKPKNRKRDAPSPDETTMVKEEPLTFDESLRKKPKKMKAPKVPRTRKRMPKKTVDGPANERGKGKGANPPRTKKDRVMDNLDIQAKNNMGKMRSSYTALENGMLLASHIASNILYSGDTLSPLIPATAMRDVINEHLPEETKDKTKFSIKAKMLRLVRDENFLSHAAYYQSKAYYNRTFIKKYKNKGGARFTQSLLPLYRAVVNELVTLFKSPCAPRIIWPRSVMELNQHYTVHRTLKSTEEVIKMNQDIRSANDANLVTLWDLSFSMHRFPETTSYKELYYTFYRFPDHIVEKAHKALIQSQVLTQTKINKQRDELPNCPVGKANRLVLSKRHKSALMTQVPHDIFDKLGKVLLDLEDALDKPSDSPALTIGSPRKDTSGESLEEFINLDVAKYQGGAVLAYLTLTALDMIDCEIFIPDDMIQLSKEGMKLLTSKSNKQTGDSGDGEDSSEEGIPGNKRRWGVRGPKKQELPEPESDRESKEIQLNSLRLHWKKDQLQKSSLFSSLNVGAATGSLVTLSRTSLIHSLDWTNTKIQLQRHFIIKPITIQYALKRAGHQRKRNASGKGKGAGKSSKKSPSSDWGHRKNEHSHSADGAHAQSSGQWGIPDSGSSQPSIVSTLKDSALYMEIIDRLEQNFPPGYEKTDTFEELSREGVQQKSLRLFSFIGKSGVEGISELDLESKMNAPLQDFKESLTHLIKALAVFKVGSTCRRYVTRGNLFPWLLEVSIDTARQSGRETESSYFIQFRPWKFLSGDLNVPFLHQLFYVIYVYLFNNPGTSLQALCNKFNPDLLPVNVLEIVDILLDLQCVQIRRVPQARKPTIFGNRMFSFATDPTRLMLWQSTEVVDVTMTSSIRLSYFLDTLESHCGTGEADEEPGEDME